jgi:hypothetical protein
MLLVSTAPSMGFTQGPLPSNVARRSASLEIWKWGNAAVVLRRQIRSLIAISIRLRYGLSVEDEARLRECLDTSHLVMRAALISYGFLNAVLYTSFAAALGGLRRTISSRIRPGIVE